MVAARPGPARPREACGCRRRVRVPPSRSGSPSWRASHSSLLPPPSSPGARGGGGTGFGGGGLRGSAPASCPLPHGRGSPSWRASHFSLLPRGGARAARNRVRWRRPARERADFVSPPPRSGLAILARFALLPPPPGRGAGGAEPGAVAAACEGARRLRVPSPTVGARHLGGLRTPPSSPGAGRGRRGTGFGGGGLRGSAPTSCPSPTVGARHPGGLRTPPSSLLPPPVQSPHTPTGAAP